MNRPNLRNLIAEVISIGDEMTSGARLDTNAQWLSRRLGELGIAVEFQTTVGDTLAHNVEVFRIAARRCDIVVATGGLGPTQDDLTRAALAELAGVELELRASALEHIESLFQRRKRDMPARNRIQAMFPAGSREIFNPQGTAPGVDLTVRGDDNRSCRFFALPGVPAEMKPMFDQTVAPRILEQASTGHALRHSVMKFFGVGESDMEALLGDMIARDRQPRVGITVSTATISLRITATGESADECDRLVAETRQQIMERVGDLYFGDGEEFEQQHALEEMLRDRGESMMLVELGHAAPLGDWFAALGETPAYRGGISLANRKELLKLAGAGTIVDAMHDFRTRLQADWALLVDEYPHLDRDDDRPIKAVEVNILAIHADGRNFPKQVVLGGHPSIVQPRIGKTAMAWMRKVIGKEGSSSRDPNRVS